MDGAAQARDRLEVEDLRGNCAGTTAAGLALTGLGTIWCGVVRREPANRQQKGGA